MTQTIASVRCPRARKALMMSCASAALATAALFPQAARAQAFQGSITSSTGSVTRVTTSSTTETLTIGSSTATINWNPANQQQGGGPLDFLPTGNTATFTGTGAVADYTVLNRILPATGQAIRLDGHVISTLQEGGAAGGHIWFYAPGGIVVGASAVFDVGSLLLTTNDVTNFGTTANGFNASFSGPSGSTSRISIESGAQINALQQNSYVALVAPRIEQGGTVRVNGSAAYVAGEQLSLTMNQGLFDIQVDVGTSDPNGIVHTGETSGPANATAADNHTIYMVAVPKNQALTMLLSGGRIGFDDAVSAQVQNGQIVLSAGYNSTGSPDDAAVGATPAAISIAGGHYSSDLDARATSDIEASGGGGDLTFDGNLTLHALDSVILAAGQGETITVGGNAKISADDYRSSDRSDNNLDAFGGWAEISAADGGTVTIAGSADVTSYALGAINSAAGTIGTAHGGTALIDADGGTVSIGGATTLEATGLSQLSVPPGIDGTNSWGGTAEVSASNSGSVHIGGLLSIVADGRGSDSALVSGGTGGAGFGGTSILSADSSGSIEALSGAYVSATGNGGHVASADGTGGSGSGGSVLLSSTNGGSVSFGADTILSANGYGATSPAQGGEGDGGSTEILLSGGNISTAGSFSAGAYGEGGAGMTGGDGYGGELTVDAIGPASFSATGDTVLIASGQGGAGAADAAGTGGAGGSGYGGDISIFAGDFPVGGASVLANTQAQTASGISFTGALAADASGIGGAGGDGLTGGAGGNGFGGDVGIFVDAGSVSAGDVAAKANGRGGTGGSGSTNLGGDGGSGFGGSADFEVANGSTLSADEYHGFTNGFGGDGGIGGSASGAGGAGQSGYDSASLDGDVTIGGSSDNATGFIVTSYAQGGTGNTGGLATAGSSNIEVGGSLTVAGLLQSTAQAGGGNGVDTGGSAEGGSASIAISGHVTTDSLFIGDNAFGGTGASAGGDGTGGWASLSMNGGAATVTTSANVQATGTGGDSFEGSGGFGSGGNVNIFAADGGTLTGGAFNLDASAAGGSGLIAGAGNAGLVLVEAQTLYTDLPATISLGQLAMTANGFSGNGAPGGGTSSGGSVGILGAGSTISAGSLTMTANGTNIGGFDSIQLDTDHLGSPAGLSFGSVNAEANGGDVGGQVFISSASGGSLDLGDATLQASGGFGGQISLLTNYCFYCGEGAEFAAQSAALPAGGGIAADNLTLNTTGNISVSLSGGADISVAGDLQGSAGQMIALTDDGTGGAIRAGNVNFNAITIDDNAHIVANTLAFTTAGDMSVGDVDASTSAAFTAGSVADFTGDISSPTITVTSGDIDIAQGASLGISGVTNLLTLNAVSNGLPIIIGDSGSPAAPGQYQLNEDGNIRATSVVINAQGASLPDVQVFDVNIQGSNTSGGGVANVTLNTAGSVFVNGLVGFTNAASTDSLTINAGNSIQVNTDTGGIQITDTAGNLTGILALKADDIWVASGSVLGQLATDVNFAGRDAALGVNSGTPNQNGFVRAGTVNASVANSFLVQNSGTPQLFAGIDTGPGGLSIASTGTSPAILIVYGRQTNATGTLITNQDFLGSVAVTGTGGFTGDSSVNGCEIGSTTCGKPTFTVDMASILGPLDETNDSKSEDKKKKDKQGDQSDDGSSADPSLRLINTTPINRAPPITEPVTSGGDVIVGGSSN